MLMLPVIPERLMRRIEIPGNAIFASPAIVLSFANEAQ